MRIDFMLVAALVSCCLIKPAVADSLDCGAPLTDAVVHQAQANVQRKLPSTPITAASAGPDGTCLVALTLGNGQTAYTDRTGRYFFFGALFDLKTGTQLGVRTTGRP